MAYGDKKISYSIDMTARDFMNLAQIAQQDGKSLDEFMLEAASEKAKERANEMQEEMRNKKISTEDTEPSEDTELNKE